MAAVSRPETISTISASLADTARLMTPFVYRFELAAAWQAAEALTKRPAGSLSHAKALMREMDKIAAQM
jgi:hypothetical protein